MRKYMCMSYLTTIFMATLFSISPFHNTESLADDGKPQNCFGPPPYNCYSIGDIYPRYIINKTNYDSLYLVYAEFAWQDFLALKFPAESDANGKPLPKPSTTKGLDYNNGVYTTVWETYTEARDLFQQDGSAPPPFGQGHDVPDICTKAAESSGHQNVRMIVNRISKAETTSGLDVLDEYIQANRMGPVVDQNGKYVRFGISFNEAMYDYVYNNKLYTPEGQNAFGKPLDWPRGAYSTTVQSKDIGAIMVKAAWKILGGNDDPSKFHRISAYVYNKAGGAFGQEPPVEESCTVEMLGLTGFHIVHRTNSSPQWIWSTFEHVDNAPWYSDFQQSTPEGPYSFFDPQTCPSENGHPNCDYNALPSHPWNPERTDLEPTQIIRIGIPGKQAILANYTTRRALRAAYGDFGTVWENYFLVDVQFPTVTVAGSGYVRNINPAYPDGLPTPTFLANSLIETYIQGFVTGDTTTNGNAIPQTDTMQKFDLYASEPVASIDPWAYWAAYGKSGGAQRNTSSCVGCHGDATMTNGIFSSYVFSLSRAQSPNTDSKKPLKDWLQRNSEN